MELMILLGEGIGIIRLCKQQFVCRDIVRISNKTGVEKQEFVLDSPHKCLILDPNDWHTMHHFSKDAILMVLASEFFDPNDYIFEPYD